MLIFPKKKKVSSPMATPCSSTDAAEHFSATDHWNALISAGQTVDFDASDYLSSHNARLPPCEGMVAQIMRSSFNNHNLTEMSSPIGLSVGIQIPGALCPADFNFTNKYTERNHNAKKRTTAECGGSLASKSDEAEEQNDVSPESIKSTQARDEKKQLLPGLNCNKSTFKQVKEMSRVDGDDSKEAYIHIRAKRGKATNSHSLAERVRREKISERMRVLQDLVPGCNKITGKAVMLDEIINYVQSLQQQVEFLTMKLATVNPDLNFDIEQIFPKAARDGNSAFVGYRPVMNTPYSHYHGAGHISSEMLMAPSIPQLSSMAEMKNVWDEELQNAIQMAFMPPQPDKNLGLNGTDPKVHER